MSIMTKKQWMEYLESTWDAAQKEAWAKHSKREWVELTEKEIRAMAKPRNGPGIDLTGRMWVFIADLTDKLQEKNHG